MPLRNVIPSALLTLLVLLSGRTALADNAADFAVQGEYLGTIQSSGGDKTLAVQVIALGDGRFQAVGYEGGLPGDGWNAEAPERVHGTLVNGVVRFDGDHALGTITDGAMQLSTPDGRVFGSLAKVLRKSPTLGAAPPAGAVVLFDGSSAENFVSASGNAPALLTDDGLLAQGANSKRRFGSQTLHLEFRTPFEPHARGQGRGNSGCYVQGRYETQILDSFGLSGENNECGGFYSIKKPDVNMCFPPMSWQTYDIDFTAAKFDAAGKKSANARMTVRHNGVVIHDDVEIPRRTPVSPLPEGPEPGFLHLQDHSNPVQFRNIWVVER